MTDIVTWEIICSAASESFSQWNAPQEKEWLENAWKQIIKADQATFSNDLEYTNVVVRLIALFNFYREFCHIFGGGTGLPNEESITRNLKLQKQNVMLLIGQHRGYGDFFRNHFCEYELYDGGIAYLCQNNGRSGVLSILFKDSSSMEWIFATLLNSIEAATPEWWSERNDISSPENETRCADDGVWYAEQVGWYRSLYGVWK